MIQGILKPMPGYSQHYRANVQVLAAGRAFTVDDAAVSDARASGVMERPILRDGEPVIGKDKKPEFEKLPVKIVDVEGQPLLLSTGAYEYMKQAFGTKLVCEPLGGTANPLENAELRQENDHLRAELARAHAELEANAAATATKKK